MRRYIFCSAARFSFVLPLVLIAACGRDAPPWETLVAQRIRDQYPSYTVHSVPGNKLLVERPGLGSRPVDVQDIAQFCQRGPKDCNYALDKMLLELAPQTAPQLR